ncbi:MAG: ATP phosphoribosyltransferase [Promethearchaeota archaeon]
MKEEEFYYKSRQVRLAVPSKGRMEKETQDFLKECGFNVQRNDRQYIGSMNGPIDLQLVYQRQVDIVRGVLNGSIELGIVGYDLVREYLPDEPEDWLESSIEEIKLKGEKAQIRVATKFPKLTKQFLISKGFSFEIVRGNGSLEVYPELGYSEIIVDLISTGKTLKDNRLRRINGGKIMSSEAVLIGNRIALRNETVMKVTRGLIEYFEATLRAKRFVSVFVNMRGDNGKDIAESIFTKKGLEGLDGPTISSVYTKDGEKMYAVHIIVEKEKLQDAIKGLREIGGSGVVVAPTLYIFEEEPKRYKNLLKKLEDS